MRILQMALRRLVFLSVPLLLVPIALSAIAAPRYPGHPVTSVEITAADLLARDRAISDDAFEGRGPGTKNGEAAAQWIADEMNRIGLKPGNHGSYFQEVPSVKIALDASKSSLSFVTPKEPWRRSFPTRRSIGRRNSRTPMCSSKHRHWCSSATGSWRPNITGTTMLASM